MTAGYCMAQSRDAPQAGPPARGVRALPHATPGVTLPLACVQVRRADGAARGGVPLQRAARRRRARLAGRLPGRAHRGAPRAAGRRWGTLHHPMYSVLSACLLLWFPGPCEERRAQPGAEGRGWLLPHGEALRRCSSLALHELRPLGCAMLPMLPACACPGLPPMTRVEEKAVDGAASSGCC